MKKAVVQKMDGGFLPKCIGDESILANSGKKVLSKYSESQKIPMFILLFAKSEDGKNDGRNKKCGSVPVQIR